jgi:hypothetical protein
MWLRHRFPDTRDRNNSISVGPFGTVSQRVSLGRGQSGMTGSSGGERELARPERERKLALVLVCGAGDGSSRSANWHAAFLVRLISFSEVGKKQRKSIFVLCARRAHTHVFNEPHERHRLAHIEAIRQHPKGSNSMKTFTVFTFATFMNFVLLFALIG